MIGSARRLGASTALAGTSLLWAVAGCAPDAAFADGATITLAERGGSHPTLAVRGDTVLVAWVGSGDGGHTWDVRLARVLGDGTVLGEARANDVPGDAAPHGQAPAQVRVAPDGTVHVVWQTTRWVTGRDFPASDLRSARSLDGGRSFEPAITVNDNGSDVPASHTFHDVAVAPDGTVLVAWIDGRERAREEARRARAEGRSYGEPVAEGGPPAGGGMPRGGHSAHADPLPGQEIRVARSEDGGRSFGSSVVVDEGPCPCCRTSLAVGGGGAVFLSWRKEFEGDVRDIVVARSEDGGRTFAAPVIVAADGWSLPACPHTGAPLALDRAGALHVMWYTGKEDGPGVYHAVSRDGGRSFGSVRPLARDARLLPARVAAVAAVDGAVWAAWEDRREIPSRLSFARVEGGRAAGLGEVEGSEPALVEVAGTGGARLAAAWSEGEAVRVRIAR